MDYLKVRSLKDCRVLSEKILKRWKECITMNLPFDQRQEKLRAKGQGLRIHLRSSTDEDAASLEWRRFRLDFIQTSENGDSGDCAGGAAQNNRGAIRQRASDGFKRFSTHDQHMPGSRFLEPLEVLRQMPWDAIPGPDDTIQGHGGDGLEKGLGISIQRLCRIWRGKVVHGWGADCGLGVMMSAGGALQMRNSAAWA